MRDSEKVGRDGRNSMERKLRYGALGPPIRSRHHSLLRPPNSETEALTHTRLHQVFLLNRSLTCHYEFMPRSALH